MTFCFVSDYYPSLPYFGGIAVYTQRIAQALAARGYNVHILVARAGQSSDVEDHGVHVHFRHVKWLPILGKWLPGLGESLGIARHLAALNRKYHFNLIEIPNWEGMGFAGTYLPGVRIIIRLHTSVAESIEMAARPPTKSERFMIWMERLSTRRAHSVVTHSLSHRDRMSTAYARNDIEVIPHGVQIPPTPTAPAGKSILSIGRMNARKGMDTLLEAIPTVLAQIPDASFRIVGAAEDHPQVKEFRTRHPAFSNVEFLGMVDEQKLHDLYNQCALYVSPAIYESFGLTFAEAMAHGRPVIGCAASAVPEIVRDGADGLLVPPKNPAAIANAMIKLLSDDSLRLRMAAAARQRAIDHFSLETAAARTESYFQRISAT